METLPLEILSSIINSIHDVKSILSFRSTSSLFQRMVNTQLDELNVKGSIAKSPKFFSSFQRLKKTNIRVRTDTTADLLALPRLSLQEYSIRVNPDYASSETFFMVLEEVYFGFNHPFHLSFYTRPLTFGSPQMKWINSHIYFGDVIPWTHNRINTALRFVRALDCKSRLSSVQVHCPELQMHIDEFTTQSSFISTVFIGYSSAYLVWYQLLRPNIVCYCYDSSNIFSRRLFIQAVECLQRPLTKILYTDTPLLPEEIRFCLTKLPNLRSLGLITLGNEDWRPTLEWLLKSSCVEKIFIYGDPDINMPFSSPLHSCKCKTRVCSCFHHSLLSS